MSKGKLILLLVLTLLLLLPPGCRRSSDGFVIALGDNILHGTLAEFARSFEAGEAEAGAVLKQVPDPENRHPLAHDVAPQAPLMTPFSA